MKKKRKTERKRKKRENRKNFWLVGWLVGFKACQPLLCYLMPIQSFFIIFT